jgi:hypothetical protein
MDKRKKYFMIIDVETTGEISRPLVYDLGFAICDKQGNIYERRSYVIEEIFENGTLMESAYYAEKIPRYKVDIEAGTRTVVPFETARAELIRLLLKYNVEVIGAYNWAFDRRALWNTRKILSGQKYFLPYSLKGLEELCIWSFACEVIFTQKTFQKVATEKLWVTETGNFKTSAEFAYRYITGIHNFEESHTGLEDVEIEVAIMAKCFAQHKKHDSGVLGNPWRIPQIKKAKKAK